MPAEGTPDKKADAASLAAAWALCSGGLKFVPIN